MGRAPAEAQEAGLAAQCALRDSLRAQDVVRAQDGLEPILHLAPRGWVMGDGGVTADAGALPAGDGAPAHMNPRVPTLGAKLSGLAVAVSAVNECPSCSHPMRVYCMVSGKVQSSIHPVWWTFRHVLHPQPGVSRFQLDWNPMQLPNTRTHPD